MYYFDKEWLTHAWFFGFGPYAQQDKRETELKESDAVAYDSEGSISDQEEFVSDDG